MIFSHTQISQYLRCPRSYRYRYLDGWQEKETRAAMVFGRSFEKALSAYFGNDDPSQALFKEWGSGVCIEMLRSIIRKESLGTV